MPKLPTVLFEKNLFSLDTALPLVNNFQKQAFLQVMASQYDNIKNLDLQPEPYNQKSV
jgi:hypothetical protein